LIPKKVSAPSSLLVTAAIETKVAFKALKIFCYFFMEMCEIISLFAKFLIQV